MELRQLRYFLAVVEHRSFSRAAGSVFISQPALSQQVQSLERELGVQLLDRLGRRVEPTAAGRVFAMHARRVLREVENTRAAMDDVQHRPRGELVVSTVQTANVGFLTQVVAAFHARHPDVVLRVREERADGVIRAVTGWDAMLGLTYLPVTVSGLDVVPLYEEELVFVSGADGSSRDPAARVDVGALAGVGLVLPPAGFCLRRQVEDALAAAGTEPRVVAEISAVDGIWDAVRAGLGASVLPERYVASRRDREGLSVVGLCGPTPRRAIGVIRRSDRHACLATRAFLELLTEMAGAAVASV